MSNSAILFMLRQLPRFTYKGLTIIMSNQSRFESKSLLDPKESTANIKFNQDCLAPELNIYQCDVRLIDDPSPLLEGTKVILLLGDKAHRLYTKANTSVDENRGSPIIVNNIPTISSFTPQDCMDIKNYESEKNAKYQSVAEFLSEEIKAGEIVSSKGRSKTARANYKFWLKQDVKKLITILNNGGVIPSPLLPKPEYHIRPNSDEIINLLTTTKNDTIHIDIETDFHTFDIRCIAFSIESNPTDVYIFPVLDVNYLPAYDNLAHIFRALMIAFRDNTIVAHNGALFDFFIFGYKYKVPIGRKVYDTLVSQHRVYPAIEKSLGHCMSLLTYEPYHKDEGNHGYRTASQAEQLMYYCGKDVYGMMLVKKAQENLMAKDPGLKSLIEWSNRGIRPYLIQTFLGMKYEEQLRQEWIKKNDRHMTSFLRCMRILMGSDELIPLGSNKKDVEYFHKQLNYKIVDTGKTGEPSLKEEALIKLKRLHPQNIVIDFLLKYRKLKKETGTLNFKPWIKLKEDNTDYSEIMTDDSED